MKNLSTVVIGGGIIGLSIAWRLVREGHQVTVVEKGKVGAEASRVAAGMLAASAEVGFEELELYHLCRESLRIWPEFARELESDSGIQVDYRSNGTLIVAHDADAATALKRGFDFQKENHYPVEWLSREETLDLEPFLSPRIVASVFASEDHAVDNRLVLKGLQRAISNLGGQIIEEAEVLGIVFSGDMVDVQIEGRPPVTANVAVIAAGAWSRQIAGIPTPDVPPVRPVKGQILELKMDRPFELNHVVRGRKAYLVPRSDGRLIVGATSEEMGFDKRMTAGGVFSVLEGAWEMVPGILDLELLGIDVGLRPGSRDHQPIVGYCMDRRLYMATGHYRHGVILSAVTALESAKSILSGKDSPVFGQFSPKRFARHEI
ncbi:MAG: glycine oxidase ThiO [Bacteroidetes bacterium]|nr:glycine oxidase ThiO [Bacteroidota bacterium]